MQPYRHQSLRVGDIQTHYLEAGEGPDLVLLHGGEYGASAEITWKLNIGPLAERFHVIVPDMLGYGLTEKIYNFSDPPGFRIKHIQRLLELIRVEKASFVGSSMGGGLLLRAAVMEPPPLRIQKLATICGNANLFKTDHQSAIEDYVPSPQAMEQLMGFLFHDRRWLAPELVQERYQSSVAPGSWEALSAARLRRPGATPQGTSSPEFVDRLSRLNLPVLIVSTAHDLLNQRGWDEKLQKLIRGSQIERFEHSAHEPQTEEADKFNQTVIRFLLA